MDHTRYTNSDFIRSRQKSVFTKQDPRKTSLRLPTCEAKFLEDSNNFPSISGMGYITCINLEKVYQLLLIELTS